MNRPHRETDPSGLRRPRFRLLARTLLLALTLAGCAVGPDYAPPVVETPGEWHATADLGVAPGNATRTAGPEADADRPDLDDELAWWNRLEDPVLSDLVRRALDGNLDVAASAARLRSARELLGVETARRWPTGDVDGSVTESDPSLVESGGVEAGSTTVWSAGVGASWEIDLFGRLRRDLEARTADVEARAADHRGLLVAIAGEVGRTTFALRSARERLEVARRNVANQEESLEIVEALVDAGRGTDLDRAQARTRLETTRAGVPALEAEEARARHRLAVLVGEPPGALDGIGPLTPSVVPDRIEGLGRPEDLLRRRPDVAAAERRLAASTADIGVVTADLFPRVSFTGSFGALATDPGDLPESASRSTSFGPFLRWSLFDLARTRNRIRAAEADAEAALADYRQTVLRALEDVETALVRWDRLRRRQGRLEAAVRAAGEATELARLRYRAGLTDFLVVLDAESRLLELEDAVASGGAEIGAAWVAIHQALGGGWAT